jgi:hypothetical protein
LSGGADLVLEDPEPSIQNADASVSATTAMACDGGNISGEIAMCEYHIRLENFRGEPIFLYQFLAADDVTAISKIATIQNIRYRRYEVWRGLEEKIAEGPRFVSRELRFDLHWAAR